MEIQDRRVVAALASGLLFGGAWLTGYSAYPELFGWLTLLLLSYVAWRVVAPWRHSLTNQLATAFAGGAAATLLARVAGLLHHKWVYGSWHTEPSSAYNLSDNGWREFYRIVLNGTTRQTVIAAIIGGLLTTLMVVAARLLTETTEDGPKTDRSSTRSVASASSSSSKRGGKTPIEQLWGVRGTKLEQLKAHGFDWAEDLFSKGVTSEGRTELANELGFTEQQILTWVNYADLLRLPGMNGKLAHLFESAGVDTVVELATRRADNLHAKIDKVNTRDKIVDQIPSEAEVAAMIAKAKDLPRKVTHA